MFKKSLLVMLTVVVIIGVLMAGCAQPEEPTPTPTPTPTPSPSPSPTPTPPPTTTEPQYGGTLRIIAGAEVDSLGWPSDQFSPEDYYQRTPALETLIRFNEKTGGAEPLLLESFTEDGDAKTVTFKMRQQEIKFHDGTPFDMEAMIWNLTQIKESINLSASWVGVSDWEVLDEYTLQINFHTWDNTFLRNMCWDSAMVSPTAYEENGLDWMGNNPVGTGPFKCVSFQRDVEKVFERFDDYWQEGKPYLDRIEIDIIADPTVQVASLLAGDHDIIVDVNPVDAKTLEGNPDVVLTHSNSVGTLWSLVGDSIHPDSPFADLKVRQAMSYAINREEINEYVFYGYGMPANQTNSPAAFTHNPNVVGYPYNPEKARELLKEAGYENGLTTTLWCRSDKIGIDLNTAIQGYLADVGIIADLQALNIGQYAEKYWATGWNDSIFQTGMLSDPEVGIQARYFFEAASPLGMPQSIIHPDEVEAGIQKMVTATNLDSKQAAAWELQALLTDEYCMYTPVLLTFTIAGKSPEVHDEYSSQPESDISGIWTFADAWLEK
jgi:peptide/nickel transport system substrate-binding protein